MGALQILSAFGLSASAGLNAYIPLLSIALLAKFTNLIQLEQPWDALTSWWIISILAFLSLVEFFADKIPAVNHINDVIQTFVRPTAGAVAFAASANVVNDISPVLAMGMGLFVAGSVHAAKSMAVRPAVTAATGGMGNIPASIAEDVFSTALSILSIAVPIILACIMVITTTWLVVWLIHRHDRQKPVVS